MKHFSLIKFTKGWKGAALLLAIIGVLSIYAQPVFAASVTITTGSQANEGIKDKGAGTWLAKGDLVQIIKTTNDTIDFPSATGGTTGDDQIIYTCAIGQGFIGEPYGKFSYSVDLSAGQKIYIRAWNGPKSTGNATLPDMALATAYGNSALTTVPSVGPVGYKFNINAGWYDDKGAPVGNSPVSPPNEIAFSTGTDAPGSLTLNLTQPSAAGIYLKGGSTYESIKWTVTGGTANHYHVYYNFDSVANPSDWVEIDESPINNSAAVSTSWIVPFDDSAACKIKVVAQNASHIELASDVSDNNFTVDSTVPSSLSPVPCKAYADDTKQTSITNNSWQKTDATPYFEWNASTDTLSGPVSYKIYWGTSSTGVPTTVANNPNYIVTQAVESPSTYYLRVEASDKAGNKVGPVTLFTFKYDATAPTVTNVTSDKVNGTYGKDEIIDIKITFSESVSVNTAGGTPQLDLNTTPNQKANYLSGSGTSTLVFRYTVQSGDSSPDLDYKAANSLTLNGGTIKDAVTNDANLPLAAPGSAGSLGFNKNIVINTNAIPSNPQAGDLAQSVANASWLKKGDSITLTINNMTDPGDQVKAQFEVTGNAFINAVTHQELSYHASPYNGSVAITAASLGNGSYKWQARVSDDTPLYSGWQPYNNGDVSFNVDQDAPYVTLANLNESYSVPGWFNAGNPIKGTASDMGGSTLSEVKVVIKRGDGQYWDNNGNWSSTQPVYNPATLNGQDWNYTGISALNLTKENTYTVTAYAADGAGNTTTSNSDTFTIDNTAPQVISTNPESGATGQDDQLDMVTFDINEPNLNVKYENPDQPQGIVVSDYYSVKGNLGGDYTNKITWINLYNINNKSATRVVLYAFDVPLNKHIPFGFQYGETITVTVKPGAVTDKAGNTLVGNQPDGSYQWSFKLETPTASLSKVYNDYVKTQNGKEENWIFVGGDNLNTGDGTLTIKGSDFGGAEKSGPGSLPVGAAIEVYLNGAFVSVPSANVVYWKDGTNGNATAQIYLPASIGSAVVAGQSTVKIKNTYGKYNPEVENKAFFIKPRVNGLATNPASLIFGKGGEVTINGAGFDTNSANVKVLFNSTEMTNFTVNSSEKITVSVPTNPALPTGTYKVKVTVNLQDSNDNKSFTVNAVTAPTISAILPANGPYYVGQTIIINGKNFMAYSKDNSIIKIGGVVTKPTKWQNVDGDLYEIIAAIPAVPGGDAVIAITNSSGDTNTEGPVLNIDTSKVYIDDYEGGAVGNLANQSSIYGAVAGNGAAVPTHAIKDMVDKDGKPTKAIQIKYVGSSAQGAYGTVYAILANGELDISDKNAIDFGTMFTIRTEGANINYANYQIYLGVKESDGTGEEWVSKNPIDLTNSLDTWKSIVLSTGDLKVADYPGAPVGDKVFSGKIKQYSIIFNGKGAQAEEYIYFDTLTAQKVEIPVTKITNPSIKRDGDTKDSSVTVSWTTDQQNAKVDIYTKTGDFSAKATDWPPAPEFANINTGSQTDAKQVGQGTAKYYKVVPAGKSLNDSDLTADVVGKFDLIVTEGSNLVALPLIPFENETAINKVIGNQLTGGAVSTADKVYYYDASTAGWNQSYLKADGTWSGTLTNLDADKGYYINISSGNPSQKVTVVGKVFTGDSRTINLYKDSNMIGSVFPTPIQLNNANLQSALTGGTAAAADKVYYWNNAAQQWEQAFLKVDNTFQGTLSTLEPGKGYFVNNQALNNDPNPDVWTFSKP